MTDDNNMSKEASGDAISERVRRIRFRMAKERTRFVEEIRHIPRKVIWTMVCLYVIAQATGQVLLRFNEMPWREFSYTFNAWALAGAITGASIPIAFLVFLTSYVYVDARRRGMNAGLWTLIVIILMPAWLGIGFLLYFLLREPLPYSCPRCAASVNARFNYCPSCQFNLRPSCPQCRREVRLEDRYCPNCASDLAATRAVPETGASTPRV